MECDGNWFNCRAGWIGKCVDSKKCLIDFMESDLGEGSYEKLMKYIKEGMPKGD